MEADCMILVGTVSFYLDFDKEHEYSYIIRVEGIDI